MPAPEEYQREAARILLQAMAGRGFALAGSGAIREHGITQRPTADVDLFTADTAPEAFAEAVGAGLDALRAKGYQVVVARRGEQFARFAATTPDGYSFDVDLGVDWRAHPPVVLPVGPVLDVEDAVASKVGALYSRGEPRDFLDVDAIRRSEQFTDEMLLEAAANHDPGFDSAMFAQQLMLVERLRPDDVSEYGFTADDLAGVQGRLRAWIRELGGGEGSGGGALGSAGRELSHRTHAARYDRRARIRHGLDSGLER